MFHGTSPLSLLFQSKSKHHLNHKLLYIFIIIIRCGPKIMQNCQYVTLVIAAANSGRQITGSGNVQLVEVKTS